MLSKARQALSASAVGRLQHRYASNVPVPVVPLWLNGAGVEVSTGGSVPVYHSRTRAQSCEVVVAGEKEVDDAVRGSFDAFQSWKTTSGWERRKILQKVLALLQERFPAFEHALRADAAVSDIVVKGDQRSAMNLTDGAACTAIQIEGSIPQTVGGNLAMTFREPFGPVLSIPAFNYPLTLGLRSIVYPLACGNTVIFKASPIIPQLHNLFAPLFRDAGLPAGVLQILNMSNDTAAERTTQLIAHPDVRMINFTGSVKLGKILAKQCGEHLKPSIMELGDKAAAVVMPSADLELAANNILFGKAFNSGQVCMGTDAAYVHESIAEEFERVLHEAAEAAFGGRKRDEGFELLRPGHAAEVESLVRDATKKGARIVYTSPSHPTSSSHPLTILASLPPSSTLSSTEPFSPLLTLHTFPSPTQLIETLNARPTGLSASVFTRDLAEALSLAREMEVGAVHVNGMTIHDQHGLPFGGVKESGWGRFNGRGAIEGFTWGKNVVVNGEGAMLPVHLL